MGYNTTDLGSKTTFMLNPSMKYLYRWEIPLLHRSKNFEGVVTAYSILDRTNVEQFEVLYGIFHQSDWLIQYNTMQYSAIQYNAMEYSAIQYNAIQYSAILFVLFIKRRKGAAFLQL